MTGARLTLNLHGKQERVMPSRSKRKQLRAILAVMAWLLGMVSLVDAAAAELRKCRSADGRIAYVSDVCPAGSRELWQREVVADPGHDAAVQRRQDEIAQWQAASRREAVLRQRPSTLRGSGRQASSANAASRCERARQRRDRIRDQAWMRMTYDRMIQLDDEVREACR